MLKFEVYSVTFKREPLTAASESYCTPNKDETVAEMFSAGAVTAIATGAATGAGATPLALTSVKAIGLFCLLRDFYC
ncbi:hypothetical protein B5S32_g2620 [[Candida] boidinii]|nr:hypothetical protein B5S32_g2620 [[Candida] boidinii]